MKYLHKGLFDNSHKQVKTSYGLPSKRARSVLNEVIENENGRVAFDFRDRNLHESA